MAKAKETSKTTAKTTQKSAAKSSDKKTKKKDLVAKYQIHKKDTGSVEVQIALLTTRIEDLVKHLKKHHKDNDSRRGLLMLVGKRRRLLNYLRRTNEKKYQKLIKELGLKK